MALRLDDEHLRRGVGLKRLALITGLAVGVFMAFALAERAGGACPESGNLVLLNDGCTPRL